MDNQQISVLINFLRYTNKITPLQQDILDTWDVLQKIPFDVEMARKRIFFNNVQHGDVFMAIYETPGVIAKAAETMTIDDMAFTLRLQLSGLVGKEKSGHRNGDRGQTGTLLKALYVFHDFLVRSNVSVK